MTDIHLISSFCNSCHGFIKILIQQLKKKSFSKNRFEKLEPFTIWIAVASLAHKWLLKHLVHTQTCSHSCWLYMISWAWNGVVFHSEWCRTYESLKSVRINLDNCFSGLQQQQRVHCHSGSSALHSQWFLEDGLGTKSERHCHGNQLYWGRTGEFPGRFEYLFLPDFKGSANIVSRY